MKEIEAWAIFNLDESMGRFGNEDSAAFAIYPSQESAESARDFGESVVRVKIEWEE